jgi:hypothetical protein
VSTRSPNHCIPLFGIPSFKWWAPMLVNWDLWTADIMEFYWSDESTGMWKETLLSLSVHRQRKSHKTLVCHLKQIINHITHKTMYSFACVQVRDQYVICHCLGKVLNNSSIFNQVLHLIIWCCQYQVYSGWFFDEPTGDLLVFSVSRCVGN